MRLLDFLRTPRGRTALQIFALVALTTLKGLFWIGLTPPLLVADEPAHFDCVQYRAEHGVRPYYDGTGRPIEKVISAKASPEMRKLWLATIPKGYYRKPHDAARDHLADELAAMAVTPANRDTDGQNPAIEYPALYYVLAQPFYKAFLTSSITTRIFSVRVLSMLFLLAATLATFFAARLLHDEAGLAFVAATLVALQPMASQQGASVNNDAGIIGVCALTFFFQLKALAALPKLPSFGTLLALVLASLSIVVTKPNGYGLLPGTAVVLLIVAFVHRRVRIIQILTVLGAAAAVGGFFMAPKLGFDLHAAIPGNTDAPGEFGFPSFWAFLEAAEPRWWNYLVRSAWGQFGWLDFSMEHTWVTRLRWIEALFELGMIAAIAQYVLRRLDRPHWYRFWLWSFAFATLAAGIVFILFVEHRFRLVGIVGVVQGRNFLYVLPAFAVWGTVCLGCTLPRAMRGLAAAALFTGIVCFHLVGAMTIAHHHYVH